jgi:hypothetical protein
MSTRYSNPSHVHCNDHPSTLFMACEIRSRSDCAIGGWYAWSFRNPHRRKLHGVRSGDLRGQSRRSLLVKPQATRYLCIWDTIFLWYWSEGHSQQIRYNATNKYWKSVLTLLKLFHNWVYNGFENALHSSQQYYLHLPRILHSLQLILLAHGIQIRIGGQHL